MRTGPGTVALANAIGSGVADDKAIYHYVPEMIRFYLGEEPILFNVPTYLMRDPDQREDALGRMDELVFKPTGESGGKGVFIGPQTPSEVLAGLADVIRAHPERWIAQERGPALDGAHGRRRRASLRHATSTCGRSR